MERGGGKMKTLNYENLLLVIVLPPFDLGQLLQEDNHFRNNKNGLDNQVRFLLPPLFESIM